MFPGAIDSTPKPSVQPLARRGAAHRSPCEPHKGLTGGWMGGAWLSLAWRFSARCKPGVTDVLLSAIYRRGVWKGTNASRTKIRFFFGVRNWMCGVRACENMKTTFFVGVAVVVDCLFTFNQPVDSDSSGFLATMELPKLCWKPRREAR